MRFLFGLDRVVTMIGKRVLPAFVELASVSYLVRLMPLVSSRPWLTPLKMKDFGGWLIQHPKATRAPETRDRCLRSRPGRSSCQIRQWRETDRGVLPGAAPER